MSRIAATQGSSSLVHLLGLGCGRADRTAGCRPRRRSRRTAATVSASPRACGLDPGRDQHLLGRGPAPPAQPASAARRVLRRCANAASTTAKTAARSTSARRLAAGERDQAGVHVGHRPEHRRRHPAGRAGVGVPGQLHRRDAVHLGAGTGGQPVGDLLLHHHQAARAAWAARRAGAARPARRRCTAGWPPASVGARVEVGGGDPQRVGGVHGEVRAPVTRSAAARRPAPGRSPRRARARPRRPGRGSASRAPGRPRARRRPGAGRRRRRCAGRCWGRARSSGRASWSARRRGARPAPGSPPGREVRQPWGQSLRPPGRAVPQARDAVETDRMTELLELRAVVEASPERGRRPPARRAARRPVAARGPRARPTQPRRRRVRRRAATAAGSR